MGSRSSRRSTKRASAARTSTATVATQRRRANTSTSQAPRREQREAAPVSVAIPDAHPEEPPQIEAAPRPTLLSRVSAALRTELPPRRVLVVGALAIAGGSAAVAGIGVRRSSINVHTLTQMGLVAVAGASVAVADTLIKRAAASSLSFSSVLTHPMMLLAVLLYVLQIVLFAYVFVKNWDLSLVGLSQMIVYAATVVFVGIILFQERITLAHGVGMGLALAGALLMNL